MICAAVPWRWSGIVGTMMTFGDFDARVVFFFVFSLYRGSSIKREDVIYIWNERRY